MCIFALISAICCVCVFGLVYTLLPQITEIIPQINTVASQMQTVLSDLEQATRQLSVMDFTGMVENVETLVTTAQEGLEETMGKLNSIDFQTLNKAIEDLSKVVEPMSKLMKVFG
jgi:predicted PurR-regulated permease PerM